MPEANNDKQKNAEQGAGQAQVPEQTTDSTLSETEAGDMQAASMPAPFSAIDTPIKVGGG